MKPLDALEWHEIERFLSPPIVRKIKRLLKERAALEEKMTEPNTFDLEDVYDEKIFPLMAQIIAICKEHHFPMFATFCYKSDPEGIDDGEDCNCTTNLEFDDHEQPENMQKLAKILMARRPSLKITVKDADGKVTRQEIITG